MEAYFNAPLTIGDDLSCRVAELDIVSTEMFANANLFKYGKSKHRSTNNRGTQTLGLSIIYFCLLNGRTCQVRTGEFTFLGIQGCY